MDFNQDHSLKNIVKGIYITPEAFKIGEAAILGMLYEVSADPSPGLVSPYSEGAHSDMDFFTFLRSSSSIAYSMYMCAQVGLVYEGKDILNIIRSLGIEAEANMLKATGGVNTQRGLLFLAGIVCVAAGSCIRRGEPLKRDYISRECAGICRGIVDRELRNIDLNKSLTNGEKLYIKYGFTGIRGEIENGLPTVLNKGIPMYEEGLNLGLKIKEALSHSLVGIMSEVEDTTVLNRCGIEGLNYMRETAKRAVETGGMMTPAGRKFIKGMDKLFKLRNISPGGAADLLAVSVMIHALENRETDF